MGRLVAYTRVSTDKQELENQRHEILAYTDSHRMGNVDEWISVSVSSRRSEEERRIDQLKATLGEGDTLIASEISRLGRSTGDVINLVRDLLATGVHVVLIKQGLDLRAGEDNLASKVVMQVFSMLAELERDLISRRTKEALAARKAQGKRLGQKPGAHLKTQFDRDHAAIKQWIEDGRSLRYILGKLGYGSVAGLAHYVNTRALRPQAPEH
jgi:DNA invertase Pin-like site-specific DNA recombinase